MGHHTNVVRAMLVVVAALAAAAPVARAEFVVVPNAREMSEGTVQNAYPFDIRNPIVTQLNTHRHQQVFASSEFATFQGPRLITEIAFRADADYGHPFSSVISNIRLNLSTTSRQPNTLSLTFADNVGADETIVHDGPLPLLSAATGPPGGPRDFDIVIHLQTPFVYDPGGGNLLLDVRNFTGERTTFFDADDIAQSLGRAGTLDAGVNSPTAEFNNAPYGLVARFTHIEVPEPATLWLVGAGALALCRRRQTTSGRARITSPSSPGWAHNSNQPARSSRSPADP